MECKGKRLRMKKKEQLINLTKLGKKREEEDEDGDLLGVEEVQREVGVRKGENNKKKRKLTEREVWETLYRGEEKAEE